MVFRSILATASSLFLKRIIVFVLAKLGAVDAENVNSAENEQICPIQMLRLRDIHFLKD
jgi:hypothetical protein